MPPRRTNGARGRFGIRPAAARGERDPESAGLACHRGHRHGSRESAVCRPAPGSYGENNTKPDVVVEVVVRVVPVADGTARAFETRVSVTAHPVLPARAAL